MKKKIIVDNDGGVDDAWAIFALSAHPDIEIVALTCVFGNTTLENVCNNNLRLVTQLFNGKEVPVYKGASAPLIQNDSGSGLPEGFQYFHGRNGFGDVELPPLQQHAALQPENAFSALNSITNENKGEITLVCLGPLTNVALALRFSPEIEKNVKEVFIMGGNLAAQGNSTKRPEFNIHVDPEAADIVFRGLGGKVTLLPWETCRNTKITLDWKKQFEMGFLGPSMQFLHNIEKPLTFRKMALGFDSYVSSDVLCAVILLRPDAVLDVVHHSLAVELAAKYTRGQLVVLDHLDDRSAWQTKIVLRVEPQIYVDILESVKHL